MRPVPATSAAVHELKPVVFVVDDDVSVREAVEDMLDLAGFDARTFGSAHEFLDAPCARVPNWFSSSMRPIAPRMVAESSQIITRTGAGTARTGGRACAAAITAGRPGRICR